MRNGVDVGDGGVLAKDVPPYWIAGRFSARIIGDTGKNTIAVAIVD